jgi:hypothetical protein
MICNKCKSRNPNGYTGLCRVCREPLFKPAASKAEPSAVKVEKATSKPKAVKAAKKAKKASKV